MFGLPLETTIVVFGFPLAWIVYTLIFLVRTRHWERDAEADDESR